VRVWNGAGLSANYCSKAIHIDGTGPTAGTVLDGARLNENCADIPGWVDSDGDTCEAYACDDLSSAENNAVNGVTARETCQSSCPNLCEEIDYQSAGGRIDVHWAGFADSQSSIVRYQWAIGSGPRPSQQLMPFVDVGLDTSGSCPPACVFDGDGNGEDDCPALCTYTVATPAVAAAAAIPGFCSDGIYSTEYDCLSARDSWTPAVPYVPAVAATAARCEMVGGCSDLEDGVTYRVTVRAWSGAGEFVEAISDGVAVDTVAPMAGAVWDGNSSSAADDLSSQTSLASLSARWSGFDDVPSGVEHYRWAVGTTPGGVDVRGFMLVPRLTNGPDAHNASTVNGIDSVTGLLPLKDGVRYFLSVMAVDHAGNTVVQSSDGVLVDSTPPDIGIVRDGPGSSDAHNQPLGPLAASWSDFIDEGRGVAKYEWAVGSSPCATDVQSYTDVGMALHARMASAEGLASETRYFVAVRATDGAGLSSAATSNGVWVAGERAGAELAAAGAQPLPLPLETTQCE
jgi:hypothetical protein